MKIISGGQIGIDIAGLRAAKQVGFETGGWMPYGFKIKQGLRPEYVEMYGMQETLEKDYPTRTKLNVLESDGTLRIAENWNSRGEICTLKAIEAFNKPLYDIDYEVVLRWNVGIPARIQVIDWLLANNIEVLNVAGNASTKMEPLVEKFLVAIFQEWVDSV